MHRPGKQKGGMDAFIEAFLRGCPQAASASAGPQPPSGSDDPLPCPPLTKAAVLLPLFEAPGDGGRGRVHVLLTVRSRRLRKHAGEVCFPGGKLDAADGGCVVTAALREAHEEIGLAPEEVEIVGTMAPTLSLHLLEVHPVVARIPHDFLGRARPNPEEVAEVFSLPLEVVLSPPPGAHSCQDLEWFAPWRMHSFTFGRFETWGLTAETLVRLCVLAFPTHTFPYDTRHPDGGCMEGWFARVLALPAFRAEAERAARRYGGGKGKGKQQGKGGGSGNGQAEEGEGDSAEAARRRRRALKGAGGS